MTTEAFVKVAIESINCETRYDIEVKITSDGSKLRNLEIAGEDNDEGDATSSPAKRAKKAVKT